MADEVEVVRKGRSSSSFQRSENAKRHSEKHRQKKQKAKAKTRLANMSEAELRTKLAGYKGKIVSLEQSLEKAREDAVGYVVSSLKNEQGGDQTEAVLQVLIPQLDKRVENLRERLEKANDHIDRLRAEKLPEQRQLEEAESTISELQEQLRTARRTNKRQKDRIEQLEKRLDRAETPASNPLPPATRNEIRAAYKLDVDVRQLRAWAEEGIGPQPPYEEPESWTSWVETELDRKKED